VGLRPGDEVIASNGTPLDDQERGQAILATLGTSSEARVTIIRNNQQQDLTLNIAQVAQEAEAATGLAPGGGSAPATPFAPAGPMAPGAAPENQAPLSVPPAPVNTVPPAGPPGVIQPPEPSGTQDQ
jgi:hypothetical protein